MTGNARNLQESEAHLHFEYRDQPSPGKGLGGRLDPNEVLDTKFYSQDKNANQTNTGVTKIDKDGNVTKMDIPEKGGAETPEGKIDNAAKPGDKPAAPAVTTPAPPTSGN